MFIDSLPMYSGEWKSPVLSSSMPVSLPPLRSEDSQLPTPQPASPEPGDKSNEPEDAGTRDPDPTPEGAWQSDSSSGSRALDEGLSLCAQSSHQAHSPSGCAQPCSQGPVCIHATTSLQTEPTPTRCSGWAGALFPSPIILRTWAWRIWGV